MEYSRRDLPLLLAALAAAPAHAAPVTLPAKAYRFEDLPVKTNGANRSRPVFNGVNHSQFPLELHETELAPGGAPHPPHHHVHEEIVLVREGTIETTIAGIVTNIGPGGVAYMGSNEEHGLRNVGSERAHYFVIALGPRG